MLPAMKNQFSTTLSVLLQDIVAVPPDLDRKIFGIALDSRKIKAGDLFIACAGHSFHGVHFADKAINSGAIAILVEAAGAVAEEVDALLAKAKVPVLVVPVLKYDIGVIAERFFGNPSSMLLTVGVTGTNGKTSCSQFLAQALHEEQSCGVIGTIGNGLFGQMEQATHTTPDAVSLHAMFRDMLDQGAKAVVMEVSSHGLHQGRVAGVAFDAAVFTNLSRDHLDYHGSMENYRAAKELLFKAPSLRYAIINADDAFGQQLLATLPDHLKKVAYSINTPYENSAFAVTATDVRLDPQGMQFHLSTPWGEGVVRSALLGRFNVSNLLAVLSTLLVLNVPFADAVKRAQVLTTVPGRMERLGGKQGLPLVVVDYAHTPDAVEKALTALREHLQSDAAAGRCIHCVLGCGGDRDKGKRPHMGAIAEAYADQVVLTNDNPRSEDPQQILEDILAGMKNPMAVKTIPQRQQAISETIAKAAPNDVIVILGKGHEQYEIIGEEKRDYPGDWKIAETALHRKIAEGLQ
ncbi:UDP-N-acetylmuramoyl-L-alanyl-D-glutamate--2,6-diaminopimelate ligase [Kaarinaea lacus]